MPEKNNVEKEVVTTTTEETVETPKETTEEEKSQEAIKQELDKVKKPKTEAEKLVFSLKSHVKRAKELGLDPKQIIGTDLGISKNDEDKELDDDTPITIGTWRKLEKERSIGSAISLAEQQIQGESERELTKHYLINNIRPSGNPEEDLKLARSLVNSIKNTQILDEVKRKTSPKTTSSGSGAPAKTEIAFEPTQEEISFMKPPFNLTKEQILEARKKE